MKTISNSKLIQRNKKISQYATYGALAFLAVGFYFTLKNDATSMLLSLIALLLGIITWQISIYYTTRWGAKVCPYELVSGSLKGLDDRYTLYHFSSPVSHLLASPSGLWIILPVMTSGKITYEQGRWKQKGTNLLFKLFAQDKIGRPDVDAKMEQANLERALSREGIVLEPGMIKPMILFLNPRAELDLSQAPVTCVSGEKVKDFLRKLPKVPGISEAQLKALALIFNPEKSKRKAA